MQTAIKFEQLVQFRIPSVLSDAIEEGREARCQSKSDFIRQVVVDRLRSSRTCSRVSLLLGPIVSVAHCSAMSEVGGEPEVL